MTSEPLNQYTEICRDAIKSSSAKVSKTFENLLLEILPRFNNEVQNFRTE